MNVSLRYATRKDAVLVADLSRQTFYETFAAQNSPEDMQKFMDEQFTRGRLIMEVGAKENTFLLAYVGGEVAGYVKLRDGKKPPALGTLSALEIARLYCATQFIGKGVGKLLMQRSIDIAREMGKKVVWLGVWEKNQRAIDFYEAWGFTTFAETEFLLGNDLQRDFLMQREV